MWFGAPTGGAVPPSRSETARPATPRGRNRPHPPRCRRASPSGRTRRQRRRGARRCWDPERRRTSSTRRATRPDAGWSSGPRSRSHTGSTRPPDPPTATRRRTCGTRSRTEEVDRKIGQHPAACELVVAHDGVDGAEVLARAAEAREDRSRGGRAEELAAVQVEDLEDRVHDLHELTAADVGGNGPTARLRNRGRRCRPALRVRRSS